MDPKQALLDCLSSLLAKDYLDATSSLNSYLEWRARGGFCPTDLGPEDAPHDGDTQASHLASMLRACWAPANHPGKFEGEPGYTVMLYEAALNGDGEHLDSGEETEQRTVHTVDLAMRAIWPELNDREHVMIWEREDGFVCHSIDQRQIQRDLATAQEDA